jgi:hypothetical protein
MFITKNLTFLLLSVCAIDQMEIFLKLPKPSVTRHSAAFHAQEKTIFNSIYVNSTTFSFHTILVSIIITFFFLISQ